jgi:hypothetical protein
MIPPPGLALLVLRLINLSFDGGQWTFGDES